MKKLKSWIRIQNLSHLELFHSGQAFDQVLLPHLTIYLLSLTVHRLLAIKMS
ncbi:hypothetical protein ACEYW6_32870 [Nostoc sp. UIC 10607]|uniref:hypothetical protein n=1 Tax=Nostoc foliaceum TaxID=2692914 RepID=UPI0016893188|nr:hypothetical protein [Nostoc foliaceum]